MKPALKLIQGGRGEAYADSLSVLLNDSTSIHMYVELSEDVSCNVSVRFDQGAVATICGYPMNWLIWDVPVDYYDSESTLGRDWYESCDEELDEHYEAYVDTDTEIMILNAAIADIKRQAMDPMFKNSASPMYRKHCIRKCEKRIKQLEKL